MKTLKGQNLRVYTYVETGDADRWTPIAMSTNCVITLTGNTEDQNTKDDVGGANKPTIVSKGWSVQVDSLNVLDAAAMLTAVKEYKQFTLMWAKSEETDNQTAITTTELEMSGIAYINDLTLTFNDRENSAKNIQFTGSGEISNSPVIASTVVNPLGAYTKGQFVRLFLSLNNTDTPNAVIAAAKQLSLHVSVQLENATSKDTTGDWVVNEPVGLSYDITSNALVETDEEVTPSVGGRKIGDMQSIWRNSTPVKFLIGNVTGANNRTLTSTIVSGSVVLSSLVLNGQNRQVATYTSTMQGYGAYTVGA